MLQCGRALFRDSLVDDAETFFSIAVQQAPESAEALALVGYCQHRRGEDEVAITTLRKALQLDDAHAEARIYLGNILYDRGDYEAALYHLDKAGPAEHWDELGIWRLMELKKTIYRLQADDPELKPWEQRLAELSTGGDDISDMLAEIEARVAENADVESRTQLELFGAMLQDLSESRAEPASHRIITDLGTEFSGSWEEIVKQMSESAGAAGARSLQEFMTHAARREYARTGILLSTVDAESFLRASADAGLLRILQ
jgi:hypothetical protein